MDNDNVRMVYLVMVGHVPFTAYDSKEAAEAECVRQVQEQCYERVMEKDLTISEGMDGVFEWNEYWDTEPDMHVWINPVPYVTDGHSK